MTYYKSGSVIIRDTISSDVFDLREADKREIWASHHRKPKDALLKGFRESTLCFTIEVESNPVAMFGVVARTILGRTASVWFLASSEMNKMQYIFKHSRRFIGLMLSYYSILENYVDVENTQSIKWLKWCGARLGLIVP